MEVAKPRRSQSLKDKSLNSVQADVTRKSSHPAMKASYNLDDSLPDLNETPKTPNNSADRLKRDFRLTNMEILALRGIMRKADLYDESVRDRMFKVLKIDEVNDEELDVVVGSVIAEKEIESLKQKLFMSRKELDSYISFTKKMEREKRQSISEKEELETKIQWHERRLTRFETENKSLKTERANLLNQIYELKGKSSTMKDSSHNRQKSMDSSLMNHQPELEISKQRLIYEADAFAQERTKLIKERQRLDEEVRKVQIRCVSLLAQLQHSEKTVEEIKTEKEQLKAKLAKHAKYSHEESLKLQERLANAEEALSQAVDENDERRKHRKEYSSFIETIRQDDNEFVTLQNEHVELERKCDALQNEYRNTEENCIRLDHENMALRDTVNVMQNAKEDALSRLNDIDVKYREALGELKAITVASEDFEKERAHLRQELEDVSSRLAELQHDAVDMEADQDGFRTFLDKLTMDLKEKLGDEANDNADADTLSERAEHIGKQVVAHLSPSRKLQDDYENMKEEKDDLEEEVRYLKFALANRLEIKNMQRPNQACECSKEKNAMKSDLEDAVTRIECLDAEVNRLHQDKQQLLMSFLNLQASQRSREVSKSDVGMTTDDDLSDEEDDDTETERESDEETKSMSSSNRSRNSLSLPAGPTRARSSDNLANPSDEIKNLRSRLEDAIRTKQQLEGERIEMLDSLCKQVDSNNALKEELEDMRATGTTSSRPASRPGSSISKSDSSTSLSQEKCPNCINYSDEIRSYLSIIEELTEDKLRLDKAVNDLETDRDQLKTDVERLTELVCKMENELADVGSMNDSASKSAKEESQFLLQNVQSLERENSVLEENLQKLREDKTEILDNLRQAEEDRFGFIRTMQILTEQKDAAEKETEDIKEEMETLQRGVQDRALASYTPLALSKEEEDEAGKWKTLLGRSYSTPVHHKHDSVNTFSHSVSDALQSPREYPLHRVNSLDDVSEVKVDALQNEVRDLREQIFTCQTKNAQLQGSLDRFMNGHGTSAQIDEDVVEVVRSNELESENSLETISESKTLHSMLKRQSSDVDSSSFERRTSDTERRTSDVERRRRGPLERKNSIVLDEEATPQQKLYQRRTSIDMSVLFDTSNIPVQNPEDGSLDKRQSAKTLSFQVSMNGVPLHEQKEF